MDRSTRRGFLTTLAGGATVLAGCAQDTTTPSSPPAPATSVELPEGDGRYATAIENTIGSVALVRSFGDRSSQGSAFVYDDSYLITNHHVIEGARDIEIRYTQNDWASGTVVGSDVRSDLAAVRVDNRPDYAQPLPLAESNPGVGTEVVALGNPLGFENSVSAGIISNAGRPVSVGGDISLPNAVQTDAALNPGNSGGPLVNLDGDVLAMISLGAGEGVGFGISAPMIQKVIPSLIETGEYRHSYIGVGIREVSPRIATANDLPSASGIYITDVMEGTPAAGVFQGATSTTTINGLSVPVGGDVLTQVDGRSMEITGDLSKYLALETSPGDTVEVRFIRDGSEQIAELTLAAREDF